MRWYIFYVLYVVNCRNKGFVSFQDVYVLKLTTWCLLIKTNYVCAIEPSLTIRLLKPLYTCLCYLLTSWAICPTLPFFYMRPFRNPAFVWPFHRHSCTCWGSKRCLNFNICRFTQIRHSFQFCYSSQLCNLLRDVCSSNFVFFILPWIIYLYHWWLWLQLAWPCVLQSLTSLPQGSPCSLPLWLDSWSSALIFSHVDGLMPNVICLRF